MIHYPIDVRVFGRPKNKFPSQNYTPKRKLIKVCDKNLCLQLFFCCLFSEQKLFCKITNKLFQQGNINGFYFRKKNCISEYTNLVRQHLSIMKY